MLAKLLSIAANNAKLAVAAGLGAALVAGGSAVAVSTVSAEGAPESSVSEQVVTPELTLSTSQDDAAQELTTQSDTPTVGITPRNHGACVSAVAREKVAGETGREHGKRVSAAAKACPKGDKADKDERKAEKKADKAEAKAEKKATKAERKAQKQAQRNDKKAERMAEKKQSGADE